MTPFTLWLTGLPASGRSELGAALRHRFEELQIPVLLLRSADLRLSRFAGRDFSLHTRFEVSSVLATMAQEANQEGTSVIVDSTAPDAEARAQARLTVGELLEVYVSTPLSECVQRDTRGEYAAAERGELRDYPGVDLPYQRPDFPEITLELSMVTVTRAVERVLELLERLAYLDLERTAAVAHDATSERSYGSREEEIIQKRLEELGYL